MNKSESKYFATAARMDGAFLALIEKKDFAYITVKEICEHAAELRMTDAYGGLNQYVFTPILNRFRVPPADQGYIMAFYISGLMAILKCWLRDDCRDSMEHIIALMQQCIANPAKNTTLF